jgi:hypothetical protein
MIEMLYLSYQERRVGIPLISLTPPHFVPSPSQNPVFPMSWRFCVHRFKARGDCSLCLKLSFHKFSTTSLMGTSNCKYICFKIT